MAVIIIPVSGVTTSNSRVFLYLDQVREDVPAGTVVGTLHSSDPDNAENITQVCDIDMHKLVLHVKQNLTPFWCNITMYVTTG